MVPRFSYEGKKRKKDDRDPDKKKTSLIIRLFQTDQDFQTPYHLSIFLALIIHNLKQDSGETSTQ